MYIDIDLFPMMFCDTNLRVVGKWPISFNICLWLESDLQVAYKFMTFHPLMDDCEFAFRWEEQSRVSTIFELLHLNHKIVENDFLLHELNWTI